MVVESRSYVPEIEAYFLDICTRDMLGSLRRRLDWLDYTTQYVLFRRLQQARLKDIGEELNISESRVSQLLNRGLERFGREERS